MWQAIAGVVAGLVQGGLSIYAANKIKEEADAAIKRNGDITLPELQELVYKHGGPSAVEQLKSDPTLKAAQTRSLDALQGIADEGGFTASDEAVLNKTMKQAGQQAATADDRVLASMAARGLGGGGQEALLRQLQSQQYAEREADSARDLASRAQDRALNAIMQGGQLAGNIRGQDWNEAYARASAADANRKYETGREMDIARYNNDVLQRKYGNTVDANTRNTQLRMTGAGTSADMINGIGRGIGAAGSAISQARLGDTPAAPVAQDLNPDGTPKKKVP